MLKISALNQFYGSSHTLRDVSLNVAEGACTVVLGRNGVGKTTLLKCLVGLLPVKAGEIVLAGQPLTRTPSHRRVLVGRRFMSPRCGKLCRGVRVGHTARLSASSGEQPQSNL